MASRKSLITIYRSYPPNVTGQVSSTVELGLALVVLPFLVACPCLLLFTGALADAVLAVLSADASLTKDGRVLAVSNMLTGYELFAVKGLFEVEPLFCFKQDVARGLPLPVRFVHGDHALIGGTLHGDVHLWDVYSRGKQVLTIGSMHCLQSSSSCSSYDICTDNVTVLAISVSSVIDYSGHMLHMFLSGTL